MVQLGTLINDRFLLERLLDQSAFGNFYLARDTESQAAVALKLLAPLAPRAVALLDEELAAYRRVSSPALPALVAASDGPTPFVAWSHRGGMSLEEHRRRSPQGRLRPEGAVLPCLFALEVIAKLHRLQPPLVHRDIRPSTIFAGGGSVQLGNFGLGCTGAATPWFAAPEQHDGEAGPPADQYGFGATIYALVTGALPPPSSSRRTSDRLLPPRQLNPDLTPELEAAVLRMLTVGPEGRFASLDAAAEALSAALPPQPCPACQADNRPRARFCRRCAAPLLMSEQAYALDLALLPPGEPLTPPPGVYKLLPVSPVPPPQGDDGARTQVHIASSPTLPSSVDTVLHTPPPGPVGPQQAEETMAPTRVIDPPRPPVFGEAHPWAQPAQGQPWPPARRTMIVGGAILALVALVALFGLAALLGQGAGGTAAAGGASAEATATREPTATGPAATATPDAMATAAARAQTATAAAQVAADTTATAEAEATASAAAGLAATAQAERQTVAAERTQIAVVAPTQTALAAFLQTAEAATATASAPTATATAVPPTATAAPQARLRVNKINSNDDPRCISVQIQGIRTRGWRFSIDGVRGVGGSFDGGGNARACGLAPNQEVTFTVFDAAGAPVRGGRGVPVRGGDIMWGVWR